ncbi:heterokaryon incompatibility protein-domain-containing protein [Immersiella caudata]|uniref:Heterokaryon incompatibility protein-domain-containing protein n=1 Tax=Immersiella caudata TaxID=314043 RepID=A0AA39XIW3_9PEZI|nr:heterokaryon incompatibility protein-domain-containing protein [Immersiella caudata]
MFRRRGDLPSTTDAQGIISYVERSNKDCHENHSCSSSQSSTFRPTRLVRVEVKGGLYAVKLVQGVAAQAADKYLTLSHCWGTNMPSSSKTLASTLQQNLIKIPWRGLTQTFRDAVATTERLGYTHIWIDSLCIIQDSKADWEAEAAVMGEVYANCDLMLSADGASNGSIGLFRSAQISSRPWKPEGVWEPSSTPAWCYQERRLAPRIIHFSMDELLWDCQRGGLCQCGAYGDLPLPTDRAQLHQVVTAATVKGRAVKEFHWSLAVTGYSEKNLTFWTDRLPALSGLAQNISLGRYLAGLWSSYLNRGLCWWADYRPCMRISIPTQYIAPSWSWMSVSGQVQIVLPEQFQPAAEVLSADCVPISPSNPTGPVSYEDPNVKGEELELMNDGPYFGLLMAKMFIMVVTPAASCERGTYERVGSVFREGFRGVMEDKSRFFEGVEGEVIRLV